MLENRQHKIYSTIMTLLRNLFTGGTSSYTRDDPDTENWQHDGSLNRTLHCTAAGGGGASPNDARPPTCNHDHSFSSAEA